MEELGNKAAIIEGSDAKDVMVIPEQNGTVYAYGNDGNDTMYGTTSGDYLYGGAGNDYISGRLGDDYLYGGAGSDQLYGDAGNDVLDGGIGNDFLEGRSGNDTYIYKKGYNNDHILNYSSELEDVDELVLEDITFEEVKLEVSGMDLIIYIKETNETVTVDKYFDGAKSELEKITFADGTVLTYNDVVQLETIKPFISEGTEGADLIALNNDDSVLYAHGKGGDDKIAGSKFNDYIYGGAGEDTIYGNGGDDYLIGGVGNDKLYGGVGDDKLYGDVGNDNLYGGAGDDKLYGNSGDDYLDGGRGNDTYFYEKGYANDRINNGSSSAEDQDTLVMSGIQFERTKIEQAGNDLVMYELDAKGSMTVENYFAGGEYALESIKFANGVEIQNASDMNMTVKGSARDNIIDMSEIQASVNIYTSTGNDKISGGINDDVIYGDAGNDIIAGGKGNDMLYGGAGNDTYVFSLGDGIDIIYEDDNTENNSDTVILGDVSKNLMFMKWEEDLIISNVNTQDLVMIQNWYSEDSHKIETFKTIDNYTLDYKQVDMLVDAMASFTEGYGMYWSQLSEDEKEQAQEVFNQFWVAPTI